MKRITLLFTLFISLLGLSAQTANDAITFGQQYHGGTARYMAMGGAFSALGGDFSTLSVNPAGLGIYRSNEFTFTMDLRFNRSTTGINAQTTQIGGQALSPYSTEIQDTKSNFNLNSVGYVVGNDMNSDGLVRLNFAVGYNRLKNYHKAYRAEVLNSSHSLTDNWANSLYQYGISGATTGAYLADFTCLLNTDRIYNNYDDEILSAKSPLLGDATVNYIKDVVEEGRINEWVFSIGGNVNHILYFGATIGIQDIEMRKEYFQTEYFMNNPNDVAYVRYNSITGDTIPYSGTDDNYFEYYSEEETDGVGLNGKFGVIVRPLDAFRFGIAVHTPTVNYLTVDHYANIFNNTYYFDKNGEQSYGARKDEKTDSYDYRTISPYKLHASVAYILGKVLALDGEVDRIDYSTMKIKDSKGRSYVYQEANDAIKAMYKTAYNARIGAEVKVIPAFAFRAGFAYYGSPYKDNISYDTNGDMLDAADYSGDRFDYSGGFGYRGRDFFMDFAYIHSVQENRTMVFDGAISPNEFSEMNLDHKVNRFMMTMGFKF